MGAIKGAIAGFVLGVTALGAGAYVGTSKALEQDKENTTRVERLAKSGQDPGPLSEILRPYQPDFFESFSQAVAKPFFDAQVEHDQNLAARKLYAMKYALDINDFSGGKLELLKGIAEEGDDAHLFEHLIDRMREPSRGIERKMLYESLSQRIEKDNFYFSRASGFPISRENPELRRKAIEVAGMTNPSFATNMAARSIEQGNDPWAQLLSMAKVGGDDAINYIIANFDNGGLQYSVHLANAVRTREQAERVYDFIWRKIDGWTGDCKQKEYAFGDMKKIGTKFGIGVPPDFQCEYKRRLF